MIRLCAFADEADSKIEGQIAALKENDISMIEVRGLGGTNVADLTEEQAEGYAKIYRENGIAVWSVGSPIGKAEITCNFAEYLKKAAHVFRLAQIFGAKRVRIFSFYHAYESEEEVIFRLKALVGLAKEYGVVLCHENEKEIYGDTVARVLRLMEGVPGLLSVFDPANFVEVGEDARAALRTLLSRTEYFHIKDVIAATREKVPAGQGDGAISTLLRSLRDRDAVLTLEPHLAVFDGYAQIDNTEMKGRFSYESTRAAFTAAAEALKNEIRTAGYRPVEGGYEK